jgi:protein-tyrosine phosphatase
MKVIDKLILKGPLYTHCFAGIERSPLICILWLTKKHKLKFQQALDYMMQAHPYTNPLPQQLDIIRSFL